LWGGASDHQRPKPKDWHKKEQIDVRLVSYELEDHRAIGALEEQGIVNLAAVAPTMLDLIEKGAAGISAAQEVVASASRFLPLDEVKLLAPIPAPRRNVICLGLNYAAHAMESTSVIGEKNPIPEFPVVFTKATTTVNGPYDDFPFDPSVSVMIDWEVELAVIVGTPGRNISVDKAMDHVYGYTVMNDISARDLQRRHKQFFKGKSLDGSCPLGPCIVTADAVADPHNLRVTTRVNGVVKQDSNTRDLIFDIPATIASLSNGMTLLSGDIIATGTPSGVGAARKPPEFLKPGDWVECEVEGIGTIRNNVVSV
jgi:2-keto-4-pentenoate hydratase/2-oxohepta-3-ene-1,7-dioic acid hydratase in catechol pathway